MMVMQNPQKWWEVAQGDDECRFFKALARHKEYVWRSTEVIAKEAKISVKRCQEIIQKYLPTGIVRAHANDPEKWQYWERGSNKPQAASVVEENQKKRLEDAGSKQP